MSEIVVRNIFDDEISALCKAEGNESVDNVQYYERYLNWQKEGECAFLIASLDGKIAGYVFLLFRDRWGSMANQGIPGLADLWVFPSCRGHGVGNALLKEAESIAVKHSNILHLDVHVTAEAGAAHRLYFRRGYVPDGKGVYFNYKPYDPSMGNVDPESLTLSFIKHLQ